MQTAEEEAAEEKGKKEEEEKRGEKKEEPEKEAKKVGEWGGVPPPLPDRHQVNSVCVYKKREASHTA